MRKEAKEILMCMASQGYEKDVADFYLGRVDLHIYSCRRCACVEVIEIVEAKE